MVMEAAATKQVGDGCPDKGNERVPTVVIDGPVCVSIKVTHQLLDLLLRNLGTEKRGKSGGLKVDTHPYHFIRLIIWANDPHLDSLNPEPLQDLLHR